MTENRRNPRKSVSERKNQLDKSFPKEVLSVLGILVAVPGVFFVGQVTTLAFLGILLAVLGFALGARRLGTARSLSRFWCSFSVSRRSVSGAQVVYWKASGGDGD